MSASVNVRDDLCVSLMNTYAELNVPNYGVDLEDMPENMDFAEVNYARMTANDSVSDMICASCTYITCVRMYVFIRMHMHTLHISSLCVCTVHAYSISCIYYTYVCMYIICVCIYVQYTHCHIQYNLCIYVCINAYHLCIHVSMSHM